MMRGIEGISAYQGIESLRGRRDPEAVEIAAKEMESLFAYELIKAMRDSSQESTKGLGSGVYMGLFDMELARLMAERGLGLKEMLLKGLRYQSSNQSGKIEGVRWREDSSAQGLEDNTGSTRQTGSALDDKGSLDFRIPVNGKISSDFGIRRHPLYGDMRFHHGIDIAAPEGTDIYPVRPGRVTFSGEQGGYGNVVVVDHGDGYITRYAHNKDNLVKTGDYVDTGTVIARVGSTGLATGPHLHFEVRLNGEAINPLDLVALRY